MRPAVDIRQRACPSLLRVILGLALIFNVALIFGFGLVKVPSASLDFRFFVRDDHLLHALAFFCLALAAFALFDITRLVTTALVGIGLGLEVLQGFTPTRQPSFSDIVADVVGIAIAAMMLIALRFAVNAIRSLVTASAVTKA